MAKATTASKAAKHVPKKRAREGVSDRGAPKKGRTDKFCKWYGARVGGTKTLKLFHFKCFSLCGHR